MTGVDIRSPDSKLGMATFIKWTRLKRNTLFPLAVLDFLDVTLYLGAVWEAVVKCIDIRSPDPKPWAWKLLWAYSIPCITIIQLDLIQAL